MKILLLFLTLPLFFGCTGVSTLRYPLVPTPNTCQVTEVRPTVLSTLTTSVCWDAQGRVIGLAGGGGKPTVSVPLDLLGSVTTLVAPIAGATILGRALIQASHATVNGSIRTTVSVPPVTVSVPIVSPTGLVIAPKP